MHFFAIYTSKLPYTPASYYVHLHVTIYNCELLHYIDQPDNICTIYTSQITYTSASYYKHLPVSYHIHQPNNRYTCKLLYTLASTHMHLLVAIYTS
uniref:Uncharacterized protein n=1 Tax=Octopus bimaculoides TaxID=37653 RepID=A0A0L8GNU3_OCTBM